MKKNGFVFVETIVVIVIVLSSLLSVYALFIGSSNTTTRRLRYDDVNGMYEAFYIHKYLNSFNMSALKERIDGGSKYELIYRGRPDIFETLVDAEEAFFESVWEELHITSIYLFPSDVSNIIKCNTTDTTSICTDKNLINYLKTLDVYSNKYIMVIEMEKDNKGNSCRSATNCYYSYARLNID